MNLPVYATREDVMGAFDVKETSRTRRYVDQALDAASRSVEGLCHRVFYPQVDTRYFDWPDSQQGTSWRLWLDDSELVSVTTLSSGGTTIASSDYILEPNRSGPPYTRLELLLSSTATFGGGSTHQRDITIDGVWAGAPLTETTLGSITAAIATTTATTINVDGATSADAGVGSILRIDSERMLVTGRAQLSTGQTGSLTASKADVSLTVASGAAFALDEVLLLDSERMRVDDIAGNVLTVERAYDGTVLAAHTTATIYAPRTLTVTRGALGTTAAGHANSSTVYRFDPPGLVRQLTKAEAITQLTQERSGWFMKASTSGNSAGKVSVDALQTLRDQTYAKHGRKLRLRGV